MLKMYFFFSGRLKDRQHIGSSLKTSLRHFSASNTFFDWLTLSQVTRKLASRSPQVVTEPTQANTLGKPQEFQVSNVPKPQVATSEAQTTASKLIIMKPRYTGLKLLYVSVLLRIVLTLAVNKLKCKIIVFKNYYLCHPWRPWLAPQP